MNPYYDILNLEQGTNEWKQERLKHLTASQVPSLFGISPYQTSLDLLREKLTGQEQEVNAYKQILFDKGHTAEIAARAWVEADLKLKFPPLVVVSKQCPDLLASLDGFNEEHRLILEAKFMGVKALEEVKLGNIKKHHLCQIQSQLFATGAEKCIYFATTGDGESAIAEIKPNPEFPEKLTVAVSDFMKDVREFKEVKEKLLAKYSPKKARGGRKL